MRKKILSLLLALTMCVGLAVPAFAAEGVTLNSQQMLAKLLTSLPPVDRIKTVRDAEYFSNGYVEEEWDAQETGMSKEAAFRKT